MTDDNLPEAVREYRALADAWRPIPPRPHPGSIAILLIAGKAAIDALIEERERLQSCEREAISLLDACFQTVDTEDAEDIVQEAFPHGAPAWVLTWYKEHPSTDEVDDYHD